jgi:hypothetical protein
MWLLPWGKLIPPYILGPLMFAGGIAALVFSTTLHWWEYILLPLAVVYGAVGTWVWFKNREDIFDEKS